MQPNPLTRRKYKGKINVKNIEKIHVLSEIGSGSEKILCRIHNPVYERKSQISYI